MEEDHKYFSAIVGNPKFCQALSKDQIPRVESLKTTLQRVVPYWEDVIAPQVRQGKRVLIVTHGTSLRGLVKHVQRKFQFSDLLHVILVYLFIPCHFSSVLTIFLFY